ncbi:uncharacterized protein N7525_008962 [Penicillium rubens]|uniref:uncharacterized protein n=1 Tax=Penicillium rubens TaxID=1108849 RepID=UPI002A5A2F53|nr:uncharacterized protein N7525_008962 [Penicillium rubens]KAJ5830709.1 hypothetical protein N7525_008962 [Penicillium rubens]
MGSPMDGYMWHRSLREYALLVPRSLHVLRLITLSSSRYFVLEPLYLRDDGHATRSSVPGQTEYFTSSALKVSQSLG